MKKMMNSKRGFTLTEIVVVIAVIVLLSSVSIVGIAATIQKANSAQEGVQKHNEFELVAWQEVKDIGKGLGGSYEPPTYNPNNEEAISQEWQDQIDEWIEEGYDPSDIIVEKDSEGNITNASIKDGATPKTNNSGSSGGASTGSSSGTDTNTNTNSNTNTNTNTDTNTNNNTNTNTNTNTNPNTNTNSGGGATSTIPGTSTVTNMNNCNAPVNNRYNDWNCTETRIQTPSSSTYDTVTITLQYSDSIERINTAWNGNYDVDYANKTITVTTTPGSDFGIQTITTGNVEVVSIIGS